MGQGGRPAERLLRVHPLRHLRRPGPRRGVRPRPHVRGPRARRLVLRPAHAGRARGLRARLPPRPGRRGHPVHRGVRPRRAARAGAADRLGGRASRGAAGVTPVDLPVASVVIPAHNEATVLDRCLATLAAGAAPGELDVVVVANACTDTTADVARRHGARVIVTPTPGKANALRLGDEAAVTFPRVYLDADVDLTIDSVRVLVATLAQPGVLAVSPRPHYELAGVRPSARRLHKVHELMMTGRRGLAGAGVYCLNEAGHARIAPFPDVISDDGFVHRSFAPGEQVVPAGARSVVRPSASFGATLQRRIRVRQGNRQLDAMGVALPEGRLGLGALAGLVLHRRVTPIDAAWYLGLVGADRTLVRWRSVTGARVSWGTDTSSRGPATPARAGDLPRTG
ncbi:glycosyltransferase [Nocardioides sp. MAH-18]|uniref:4,4'-diaponeurosporenoate glycosyltransferase n=1 Tax=Nocardioides agri TaxID=2682843 RepID=A0A6L6XQX5_9ACTN|nr:glycosyltransferase [Nocardioides sp. MAH-18]